MKEAGLVVTVLLVAGLVACGGGNERASEPAPADTGGAAATEAPGPSASGAPQVEDAYQSDIDEAWGEATRGEDPSATCAAVKGAASVKPGPASKALQACDVDIPVRYFMTRLDRAESGDESCMDVVMSILTKLPAMTISVGSATENHSAESRAAVKARLQPRVNEICPDQVDMLQG